MSPSTSAVAPATIAGAVRIAVEDGRALLAAGSDAYTFASDTWHIAAMQDLPCVVCAAGAVMARRLAVARTSKSEPGDHPPQWECALQAIDSVRAMDWAGAWREMHLYRTSETALTDPDADRFSEALDAALIAHGRGLRKRLVERSCFATREEFAAYLDALEHGLLALLAHCEEDALKERAGTSAA